MGQHSCELLSSLHLFTKNRKKDMVTVKKWPRRQNVDSNRGNVTVTMWHRLREMRHKSIVYFYHLKKGTKHVFTATGLTDDRCCSLHPPELKSEWGSSSFISCCGSLSSSASSRWFCSRTWTLCISWHRLVCPVAGPSSSFAVRWKASREGEEERLLIIKCHHKEENRNGCKTTLH